MRPASFSELALSQPASLHFHLAHNARSSLSQPQATRVALHAHSCVSRPLRPICSCNERAKLIVPQLSASKMTTIVEGDVHFSALYKSEGPVAPPSTRTWTSKTPLSSTLSALDKKDVILHSSSYALEQAHMISAVRAQGGESKADHSRRLKPVVSVGFLVGWRKGWATETDTIHPCRRTSSPNLTFSMMMIGNLGTATSISMAHTIDCRVSAAPRRSAELTDTDRPSVVSHMRKAWDTTGQIILAPHSYHVESITRMLKRANEDWKLRWQEDNEARREMDVSHKTHSSRLRTSFLIALIYFPRSSPSAPSRRPRSSSSHPSPTPPNATPSAAPWSPVIPPTPTPSATSSLDSIQRVIGLPSARLSTGKFTPSTLP